MSARTKARKRAVDMLFQGDVLHRSWSEILEQEAKRALYEPERRASWEYAREIVTGVIENHAAIDEQIAAAAEGWTLERMPNVDRATLRVATWEICFNDEIPAPVAISEAVALVKEYSTDDSGSFVNGVLGRIAELRSL